MSSESTPASGEASSSEPVQEKKPDEPTPESLDYSDVLIDATAENEGKGVQIIGGVRLPKKKG